MIRYERHGFVSNPGNSKHILYSPSVSPTGEMVLVASGVEDTDAYINSFRDSTDISVIMQRVAAGEVELLNKRPGSYGDFTKMPKTFAETLQLQIDSNRLFDSLPVEVKKKFNNDPNQFFAQAGNKEWFESIEPVLPDEVKDMIKPKVDVVEPVKPVEVKE